MKKVILMAAFFAALASCGSTKVDPTPEPGPGPEPTPGPDTPTFYKGADISWASEMEAGGVKFKKKDGTEAPLLEVLKSCGINAIRLRVWVKPYGGWSGKADVLSVAKKVQAAGMSLMVDFHYSDFFADPSRQTIPEDWKADKDNLDKMCQHVSAHTKEVLQALKDAGVTVKWVQIGNETRNGMLWPAGQLWTDSGDIADGRKHFAKLYNAGYDAAKAVFSGAVVMPHLNNAYEDNDWWFQQIKAAGGKFDAIALSHYPQAETKYTAAEYNQKALDQIRKLHSTYQIPILISEVGVKPAKSDAASVLASFVSEVKKLDYCQGVFYWEPQVYGGWVPAVYKDADAIYKYTGKRETWGSYDQAAFTASGSPSSILDCFAK
jgi:arabinogalactan endo-1,4-beta-galactosidase